MLDWTVTIMTISVLKLAGDLETYKMWNIES